MLLVALDVDWSYSGSIIVISSSGEVWIYRLQQRLCINWCAMARHASQFVWYRRLFVVFSSYTYCNTLRRIPTTPRMVREMQDNYAHDHNETKNNEPR